MPFSPPKKRAQGFDVVRYRRRCGERLGCFGVCADSRTCRGVGEVGFGVAWLPLCLVAVATWLLRCLRGSRARRGVGEVGFGVAFVPPCLAVVVSCRLRWLYCLPGASWGRAAKPPLCKGRWQPEGLTEGLHAATIEHPGGARRNRDGGIAHPLYPAPYKHKAARAAPVWEQPSCFAYIVSPRR